MVDPSLDITYGPNPVQKTGTVTVPRDLLREIGVEGGRDRVLWALNPDLPGTLVLIPAELFGRAMPGVIDALKQVAR